MTKLLALWNFLGSHSNRAGSLARLVIYGVLLFLAFECITIDFQWPEQAVLGTLTMVVTYAIHRISKSESVTLALMFASMLATSRYFYWRVTTVAGTLSAGGVSLINIGFMILLLTAETYAFVVLYLGYIQSIRPLRRMPAPLPKEVEAWPHVDVLIPTYNEPLSVVRSTAFAAMNIDYPGDKLHVYVLDDGRREEFRKFCAEAGVGYVTRNDNRHAKAGNINHALSMLSSPYVAIFDCDHVPTRSFLQITLGWFLRDTKLGMLQTPHMFYSPDPFERNLDQFTAIPNEGELFYGVIQDGNDLWNSTFFCGSCAVLRRTALDQIGGIAVDTVTEDAHTSIRMQVLGWNSAYINIPQAAGLATESLSGHVGQRVRWARGMIQILRRENPLFMRGLDWPQRLCYFNSTVHFLYAGPRLIFLTAPLVYMLLGCINIPGHWIAILAYAFPHMFLSNVTNFRIQGKHRHSFWNEVYETVLAPYILGPTLLALINPKLGKFNVTAKGGVVKESYFDARIARPYIVLTLLNVLGLLVAPIRFFTSDAGHPGTVAMNVFWILFNLVIVGTANAVAFESRQMRADVRVNLQVPVELRLANGRTVLGESCDLSLGGALIRLDEPWIEQESLAIQVLYPLRGRQVAFPALIKHAAGTTLRLAYRTLSLEEEEQLTLVLYSGADTWINREARRKTDRPFQSFARLVGISIRGVGYALGSLIPRRRGMNLAAAGAKTTAIVLFALCFGLPLLYAQSNAVTPNATPPLNDEGVIHSTLSLKQMGLPESVVFRGVDASRAIPFSLPATTVPEKAILKLQYAFSPGLLGELSHLSVLLNGELVATLPAPQNSANLQEPLSTTIALPVNLLARNNTLGFEFIGHYTHGCEDPAHTTLWARVENASTVELTGSVLSLGNDLKMLPSPFYDGSTGQGAASLPFYFASSPGDESLAAAGVVASWFGVLANSRSFRFPVDVGGDLPKGNFVFFADRISALSGDLDLHINGSTIAVRTNPVDPYGKVLVLSGENPSQLLTAARALAAGSSLLQGDTADVTNFTLPAPRSADDAPLWLRTDRASPLWENSDQGELQGDGSGPLPVYLRVPPDLYFGDRQHLPLHLDYRYNTISLAKSSSMRVTANGSLVSELPLPHDDKPKKTLSYDAQVPLVSMRPFANTFLFDFYFQLAKTGACQDTPPIDLQGGILRSSYLDLRGLKHWAAMPNLELFADAGFPFTRFADLSQTMIVLPSQPGPQEIALYLSLLAYFGEQTGYPALRVQVSNSLRDDDESDVLILGTPDDQPAFTALNAVLPVQIRGNGFSISNTGGFFAKTQNAWWQVAEMRPNWWRRLNAPREQQGLLDSISQFPDALVQGVEAPWSRGRSVVTITLKSKETAETFAAAFWQSSMSGDIGQSVSVLHDGDFSSYRLGSSFYHVGDLPIWSRVRYSLRTFPWLIVLLTFVLGLFVVPWTRLRLDNRVRERLEGHQI